MVEREAVEQQVSARKVCQASQSQKYHPKIAIWARARCNIWIFACLGYCRLLPGLDKKREVWKSSNSSKPETPLTNSTFDLQREKTKEINRYISQRNFTSVLLHSRNCWPCLRSHQNKEAASSFNQKYARSLMKTCRLPPGNKEKGDERCMDGGEDKNKKNKKQNQKRTKKECRSAKEKRR